VIVLRRKNVDTAASDEQSNWLACSRRNLITQCSLDALD